MCRGLSLAQKAILNLLGDQPEPLTKESLKSLLNGTIRKPELKINNLVNRNFLVKNEIDGKTFYVVTQKAVKALRQ
jgi:hypothetical protein